MNERKVKQCRESRKLLKQATFARVWWKQRVTVYSRKYCIETVRRVEIPKPDGGMRLLGVPTVTDRMIQQALVQVLQPIFEPTFSDNSFGFRPKRNAQQAMKKAKEYYEQGYTRVIDTFPRGFLWVPTREVCSGCTGNHATTVLEV